jgi:FkbM family methyltransferase
MNQGGPTGGKWRWAACQALGRSALFTKRSPLPSENKALESIELQNAATLKRVEQFRRDSRSRQAKFEEFLHLKHTFPYFGFVPCHAGGIDFTLFHANDDIVAWEYLWFGPDGYEHEIVETWVDWCSSGAAVVLDIGGYTGHMSVLAALANRGAIAHLFEPMSRTIERAKINVRANGVGKNVHLHNLAASNSAARTQINLPRKEDFLGTGNSLVATGAPIIDVKEVQCVEIDTYLPDVAPTLVKIDVEGHEQACIEGMIKTLRKHRPRIVAEIWQHTRREVLMMLDEMGYRCRPFEKHERNVMNFRCEPR